METKNQAEEAILISDKIYSNSKTVKNPGTGGSHL
jgi:hypothetical protein